MTLPTLRATGNPQEGGPLTSFSLEVNARDMSLLASTAPRITPGSMVSIPCLRREHDDERLAALCTVRGLGFEPMPHIGARAFPSLADFRSFIERAVAQAGVSRCLVIAGDPSSPRGPFADSTSLIDTGVLERAGISAVGVAGHPAGHPVMSMAQQWEVLERKCRNIEQRGMTPSIVTQFDFDADLVLTWLQTLRNRGISHPVRIGVPGPASMASLVRYAAMCGVSACTSMLSKYGVSLSRLLGTTGPDRFVDRLRTGLTHEHGDVSLHLFPFGGVAPSVTWIEQYRRRVMAARTGDPR